MALVEQDVCHVMISGIDDQSLDPPDSVVGGIHVLAAAHLHFTHGDMIVAVRMGISASSHPANRQTTHAHATAARAASAESEVGQREHLVLLVAQLSADSRQELCL